MRVRLAKIDYSHATKFVCTSVVESLMGKNDRNIHYSTTPTQTISVCREQSVNNNVFESEFYFLWNLHDS